MFRKKYAVDRKTERILKKVNEYREEMRALDDETLKAKTEMFKKRISNGETLEQILPEAFAAVREASRRVTGMEPFDVQVIGGIVLHNGKVAEMKTGEGKTLVAVMPSYLNALAGKGVHVVTVNDYLAERDAKWMGDIHRFMGLSVGVVLDGMTTQQRKEAYACDITYVTNNELGFDYLRDNMAVNRQDIVLRGLNYCIIDEVDSILIDEARTPLIISGQGGTSSELYEACDKVVKSMTRGEDLPELSKADIIAGKQQEESGDYVVNEKDKYVSLTEEGVKKAEKFFGIENLTDPSNTDLYHCMTMALRANSLMRKDRDYIVRDGEIMIVDEFTGRIMPGRRYSDGLHQAIEAKEHVDVRKETKTYATVTFQNFFNKFNKKSGMTGTAATEAREFKEIYGLDIVAIPTNRPVVRIDMADKIFKTKAAKYENVIKEVKEAHRKGQPVLVGTASISVSEELSVLLKKEGIAHSVLNAKEHEKEAQIIEDAGKYGSVTIATNMAGRGTDIKLDERAKEAGGLYVIGTERHESRRIDNQLRGRSGRQGDPGKSVFFISLEDDLLKLFGGEKMKEIYNSLGIEDCEDISDKTLSKAVERAQRRVEGNNFTIRKSLMDYDRVNNEQREKIYAQRMAVLNSEDMRETICEMIADEITDLVGNVSVRKKIPDQNVENLCRELESVFDIKEAETAKYISDKKETIRVLTDIMLDRYESIENMLPTKNMLREIERQVLLKAIDRHWMEHIDQMDRLRQSIRLQSFGQKDPKIEYRKIGYEMFEDMSFAIICDTLSMLFRIQVSWS